MIQKIFLVIGVLMTGVLFLIFRSTLRQIRAEARDAEKSGDPTSSSR